MRGPALSHSGPVQNTLPRVSFSTSLSVERVSTNIYYFNNTWTKSRGLVTKNILNRFGAATTGTGIGAGVLVDQQH